MWRLHATPVVNPAVYPSMTILVSRLLQASHRLVVATGIASIWAESADNLAPNVA